MPFILPSHQRFTYLFYISNEWLVILSLGAFFSSSLGTFPHIEMMRYEPGTPGPLSGTPFLKEPPLSFSVQKANPALPTCLVGNREGEASFCPSLESRSCFCETPRPARRELRQAGEKAQGHSTVNISGFEFSSYTTLLLSARGLHSLGQVA